MFTHPSPRGGLTKFEFMELDDNDTFWEEIISNKTTNASSSIQQSRSASCFIDFDEESILVNISEGDKSEQHRLTSPFDLPPGEGGGFEDHMLTQLEDEPRILTGSKSQDQAIKVISVEEWSRDKTTLLSLLASIEQLGLGLSFPLESLIGTNAELDKKYKMAQR